MPANKIVPRPGDWPCQQSPILREVDNNPRLVSFLYLLLRDGADAPGDVEQLAINAGADDVMPVFTNPHLEKYARSLAAHLLDL